MGAVALIRQQREMRPASSWRYNQRADATLKQYFELGGSQNAASPLSTVEKHRKVHDACAEVAIWDWRREFRNGVGLVEMWGFEGRRCCSKELLVVRVQAQVPSCGCGGLVLRLDRESAVFPAASWS